MVAAVGLRRGRTGIASKWGHSVKQPTKLLSIALTIFGVIFCLIYPLAMIWPSGWAWHSGAPHSNDYYMMIVGVYATLGIFLIRASWDPLANASLIWFTVWSSVVHALIMAWGRCARPDKPATYWATFLRFCWSRRCLAS